MIPIVRLSDSTYSSTQVLTYKLHLSLLLYYLLTRIRSSYTYYYY